MNEFMRLFRNVSGDGGYVSTAQDMDEAIAFGKTCPILRYPQASVEVRAILPFEL